MQKFAHFFGRQGQPGPIGRNFFGFYMEWQALLGSRDKELFQIASNTSKGMEIGVRFQNQQNSGYYYTVGKIRNSKKNLILFFIS